MPTECGYCGKNTCIGTDICEECHEALSREQWERDESQRLADLERRMEEEEDERQP